MKALAISDLHGDATLFGLSRFDEFQAALDLSVDTAVAREVDHYFFTGDATDPDSGAVVFRVVRALLEAARRLDHHGIRSHWLSGNHDVCEDGTGTTTLTPLRALQGEGTGVRVYERPELHQLGGGLSLLALPFTPLSHGYSPHDFAKQALERDPRSRIVVLSHMTEMAGVTRGEESAEMARGRDVTYPAGVVEAAGGRVLASLAGHWHKRQVVRGVQVVGAPARFAFGEAANEPGFLIVNV